MSVAVSELIARELLTRLERLLVPAAYNTEASQVVRPLRYGGFTPKDLQIVLTQDSPIRNEELDCPGNPPKIAWDLRFNIRCHVMPSESNTTPVDDIINTMSADVVKAVCLDSSWQTMDGNAINSHWQDHENIDGDGSFDGVNLPLVVTYRVQETDPYQVG